MKKLVKALKSNDCGARIGLNRPKSLDGIYNFSTISWSVLPSITLTESAQCITSTETVKCVELSLAWLIMSVSIYYKTYEQH